MGILGLAGFAECTSRVHEQSAIARNLHRGDDNREAGRARIAVSDQEMHECAAEGWVCRTDVPAADVMRRFWISLGIE